MSEKNHKQLEINFDNAVTPHYDGAISDILSNPQTGHGTAQDKSASAELNFPGELTPRELSTLYRFSPECRKVVNALPKEVTREWLAPLDLGSDGDSELVDGFHDYQRKLNTKDAVLDALTWSRLYGGACIVIGVEDGQKADQPIKENKIKSVQWLKVLDRWQIYPDYGESRVLDPEYYRIASAGFHRSMYQKTFQGLEYGTRVHRSRVLRFDGVKLPYWERIENWGWGDSILNSFYASWRQFWLSLGAASQVLQDMDIFVHSIKDLGNIIKKGGVEPLQKYLRETHMAKSVFRSMIVDGETDSVGWQSRNLSNIDNIIDKLSEHMSAAADVPYFVLWGTVGRAKLGDSYSSEKRAWAEQAMQAQQELMQGNLERLARYILKAKDSPSQGNEPEYWKIRFNNLFSLDSLQEAELKKNYSEIDANNIASGIYSAQEARQRYESAEYRDNLVLNDSCVDADDELDEVYSEYKRVTNMSYTELKNWSENECSKQASVDREAINRNLKLLNKKKSEWTSKDIKDAKRTISFINRMRGVKQGEKISKECPYSKRDISLLNWAFSVFKNN